MPTKLGQNFLKDEAVLQKIIESADLNENDIVLEIGPGKGALTEKLIQKVKKVIAIEVDPELVSFLHKKFKNTKNLEVVNDNILNVNVSKLVISSELQATSYKITANIPYYITSPIIRLFLESTHQPQEMILMVQKEVAERIVAKPGNMSILAISVQYYAQARILFDVPASAFEPKPEVDSAIIRIVPQKIFEQDKDKAFFRIIKAGFSAKRKTLLNNLSNSLHMDKKIVTEKLASVGLSEKTRAQELSLEEWKKLKVRLLE